MESKKLLTIVVPTHNRSKYAYNCIKSILNIDVPELELVVSDTSTDGELEKMIDEIDLNASRVCFKYYKHAVRLDMTENHNYALTMAGGEYVCLIGDDDSVSKEIIQAVRFAKLNDIKSLTPKVSATYNWPDFVTKYFGNRHAGRLYLSRFSSKWHRKETKVALLESLSKSSQGTDGLPKIYHGIVRRDVIEKITHRNGKFFYGTSPDMSGAVALALELDAFYELDYPLTIPGASGGSNTGRSALNKHKGSLKSEAQTKAFEASWDVRIPSFFSVETVWAHAAIETIKVNCPDYVNYFNFPRLYALCLANHEEHKNEIFSAIRANDQLDGVTENSIRSQVISARFNRIKYLIKRALRPTAANGKLVIGSLDSVENAPQVLSEYLNQQEICFDNLVRDL